MYSKISFRFIIFYPHTKYQFLLLFLWRYGRWILDEKWVIFRDFGCHLIYGSKIEEQFRERLRIASQNKRARLYIDPQRRIIRMKRAVAPNTHEVR